MINIKTIIPLELSSHIKEEIKDLEIKIENALESNDTKEYSLRLEQLADLLREAGLYDEARKHYLELEEWHKEKMDKARMYRKIAHSHSMQKTCKQAPCYIEKAEEILIEIRKENQEWYAEYLNMLMVKNDLLYYGAAPLEKIMANNDLIKNLLKKWGNEKQELEFYRHVLYLAYRRYRYNNFPDEMLSHAFYYRHLAVQKKDEFYIADNLENLAFIYLWRKEFSRAIETFKECIELIKGKQSDLLIISNNYIALAYRMMNRVQDCEEWTNKTYQLAEKTKNETYLGQMLGNFGWLHLKRNNELYAENFAQKGFSILSHYKHPFLWITTMPLIAIYAEKKDWENAGRYAHCLLHPNTQKLPDQLESSIKNAIVKWQLEDWEDIELYFNNIIIEARLNCFF